MFLLVVFMLTLMSFYASMVTYLYYLRLVIEFRRKDEPIELLRDALLSFALLGTGRMDNNLNLNYDTFDGSLLPSASGFNVPNACFSYLSSSLPKKLRAIEKYIDKNLNTNQKVEIFFVNFLKSHGGRFGDSSEQNGDVDVDVDEHGDDANSQDD